MTAPIILDLCGGTGAWSRPYRDAGYDVRVITLPDYDLRYVHFDTEAMLFMRSGVGGFMSVIYDQVYGILAAPPCTEFSIAKSGSRRSRDLKAGLQTVEACMRIIWECRLRTRLNFWALENPVGFLRQFLGKPSYTFYQWWFGDLGIKRTDLWGYFNVPRQTVQERPNHPYFIKQYQSGKKNQFAWAAPQKPDWYDGPPLDRAALRAITPEGFAKAFYKANSRLARKEPAP